MTLVQSTSLILLLVVLLLAVWQRLNIGVLALAAAFIVMLMSHTDPKAIYDAFPGNLVVLIVGVSLLFAHVERSGALRAIVEKVYQAVGPRQALIPWVTFVIAAAFSSAGAFSTAPIAFLVPMVAFLGVRYVKMFYLAELAVVIGANAAALSPLNPTGASVAAAAEKMHVHYSHWGLWAVSVVCAALVMLILQLITVVRAKRGNAFVLTPAPMDSDGAASAPHAGPGAPSVHTRAARTPKERLYAVCAGLALLVFLVCVVVFKLDVGLTSIILAVLLQLFFRPAEKALLSRVPWNAILLLTGLLTYLGLIQQIGTMKAVEHALTGVSSGIVLILVLAYLTALLCNIESSSIGVLNLMMPLVFGAFGNSPGLFLVLCAVCVPAVLTVMNPIHVAGTLIIANSAPKQQDLAFRKLFLLSVCISALVPGVLSILAWLGITVHL